MKRNVLFQGAVLITLILPGCGSVQPKPVAMDQTFTDGTMLPMKDSFAFCTTNGAVQVLDYETMKHPMLCNKPNCTHTAADCIEQRLHGNVPLFGDGCAYYFVDDEPKTDPNSEGKIDLTVGSALCRYDFASNTEEELVHVDASVSYNCYGWMLKNETIYFIENQYSRNYDENGILSDFGNIGGEMSLCSVRLSDLEVNELCALTDYEELTKHYDSYRTSGCVYMKGAYDNKIYFNVGFLVEDRFRFYVTYYDLNDGTYHGTPENYDDISYSYVMSATDDTMVIGRDGIADVYRKGSAEPVTIEAEGLDDFSEVFLSDGTFFFDDKAIDLKTKEVRTLEQMKDKSIIEKYGDSFIISDYGMQSGFEKIPAEKLLN